MGQVSIVEYMTDWRSVNNSYTSIDILQQRHLSRLREFDLTQYSEFLRDLDGLVTAFENEKTAAGQWQVLAKIRLGLIAAQDIGDEKMATAQVHKFEYI